MFAEPAADALRRRRELFNDTGCVVGVHPDQKFFRLGRAGPPRVTHLELATGNADRARDQVF